MSAIIELANRLGKAIADSPQAAALREARQGLEDHPEVKELLRNFREQSTKIMQLEAEQKPVDVEDKHKLQDLQTKLVATEVFKKFTAAQVEYIDMMRQVNEAMQKQLNETESDLKTSN